jgi:WD40-like Beta Propeller Repeat
MRPASRMLPAVAFVALLFGCGTESDRSITANVVANVTSHFSSWSDPSNLGSTINTTFNEQGPTLSNDELSLYFGSDRPGGIGGFDIWVSQRACKDCAWETPLNLGPGVNTSSDETGPGLSVDGHLLFLRSTRPGGAGLGDVYLAKRDNPKDDFGWGAPVALGPDVNTAAAEAGAEFLQSAEDGPADLYFNRGPAGGAADLYYVAITRDGETGGPAALIAELSDPVFTDQGPTLRSDGREIFFFSTRPGGSGGADLWTSTRRSVHDPWTPPVNLGAPLNSTAAEQQPSLSSGGLTLLFASSRAGGFGGTDIWVSTRTLGQQHSQEELIP